MKMKKMKTNKKILLDFRNQVSTKTSVLMAIVLLSFLGNAQDKKWTLQEAVNHALEHNISVQQSNNTLLGNEQDIKAAKGQFLPSVSGSAGHNLTLGNAQLFPGQFVDRTANSTNIGIGANQTVFNGFRTTNLYKQSQLNLEASELELARIKDDISLNVVNGYLNILFNKENLEIAKSQYDFTKKQLEQVKQLVEAGVQPRANIFDTEATLSTDLQNVTIAENNYELSLLNLSQLLQVEFSGFDIAKIEINTPSSELLYTSIDPILEYAIENRNEIKFAEKNIELSKLGTQLSKSGFYPNVTAGYSFGSNAFYTNLTDVEDSFFNQLNDQKSHNLRLSVNVPIFSQYQNKTAVAKAKIQEDNAQLNLEQAKLNLQTNIQRAFTDAKSAFRAYEAAKKSLEAQKTAFNNASERYNIGAMNAFDLEQSRLRLVNAEASLVNAKYDFVFKTKVLDFYLGKPITQ